MYTLERTSKSYYITLNTKHILKLEMYGLVTVWTSMDDGLYWVILLKYGSHDMRHTGFHRLTVVNGLSRVLGCHNNDEDLCMDGHSS